METQAWKVCIWGREEGIKAHKKYKGKKERKIGCLIIALRSSG